MIIGKRNIVKSQTIMNSPKKKDQEGTDKSNNKIHLMKKSKININGNIPIRSRILGQRIINKNQGLISSFNLGNYFRNKNDEKACTSSSFYKKNYKIPLEISNGDKTKTNINKISELLNKKQNIKGNNIININKDIISFNKNKNNRYFNDDKKSLDNKNNQNDYIQINKSLNDYSKKKYLINLGNNSNKNINKDKRYSLIIDIKNENDISDIDNYIKTEQKETNISKHKIRNILSKNFSLNNSKPKLNTFDLFNIKNKNNNNNRINKSPPDFSKNAINDFKKNHIKNVKSNNINETKILNNINNNIIYNHNKNEKKETRHNNSPVKFDYYNNKTHKINKVNSISISKIDTNRSSEVNNDNNEIENEIIFKELILYEEKLNDIYISINVYDNNKENDSMNYECLVFFNFYLNSSLKNKLSIFFSEDYYNIIMKSYINLQLFIIIFVYHLSFDSQLLNDSISLLIDIFNKFKYNFYLLIRQLFNNNKFLDINSNYNTNIYFNNLKKLLNNSIDMNNLSEDEIIVNINDNCTYISSNIHRLLNYYNEYSENNNINNYYKDFMNIFNQISIISENDIKNFFYDKIYNKKLRNISPYQYNNKGNNSFYRYNNKRNKNISNSIELNIYNNSVPNINNIEQKQKMINDTYYISSFKLNTINNVNYTNNIIPPFIKTKKPANKRYTLILDLDETLIHVKTFDIKNNNSLNPNVYNNTINPKIINLRPGLFSFLNSVKPFYEIISFSCASKEYAEHIIKQIETNQKYFDHNLYRQHTTLHGKKYIKDISKIGRNIKEMIIVDNLEENFILNPDNGIKIAPYYGEIGNGGDDNKLFELQKLLILFYKLKYNDLRMAIKDYEQFIIEKISSQD